MSLYLCTCICVYVSICVCIDSTYLHVCLCVYDAGVYQQKVRPQVCSELNHQKQSNGFNLHMSKLYYMDKG